MNRIFLFLLILVALPFFAQSQANLLQQLLGGKSKLVDSIVSQPEKFGFQLIYTQIERDENQQITLTSHRIGVDSNQYFYPASTVKLPTSILALEKLNDLQIIGLNRQSHMKTGKSRPIQTERSIDLSSKDSVPSIEQDIKKIFLFSENDAYNRLFEFIGVNALNNRLTEIGLENHRIVHRVGVSGFSYEENRYTNPISFYSGEELLYHQGAVLSSFETDFIPSAQVKGKGFMKGDQLIESPMDFSQKNFIPLQELQGILQRVIFPNIYPKEKRYNLSQEDYNFLLKSMATYPSESLNPKVDYPDGYVKFFLFGGQKKSVPKHIRIFNKVGDAYGFLTDVAYIVDLKNNVEFLLAGVIHVNENEIYNDNNYQYEEIGFPFFQTVGEVIYEYELKRARKNIPDLSKFKKLFPQ